MKRFALYMLVLTLLLGLALTACQPAAEEEVAAPAEAEEEAAPEEEEAAPSEEVEVMTVTIPFHGAITGTWALVGGPLANGVELAVDDAHDELLEQGIDLQFAKFDEGLDPAQSAVVARKVITDETVLAVAGPMFGTDTISAAPLYTEANLAMFSLGTAAELTTHDWTFFRLVPNDDIQGKVLGEFPVMALDVERYAVIDDGSSYGTGLAETVAAAAEAAGAEIVVREGIDINADDFSPTIAKIIGADAQAAFLGGSFAQVAAFNRQLVDKGYTGIFIAPDGSLSPDYITQAGPSSEGTYFTSQGAPTPAYGGPDTGPLADFVTRYQEKFGEDPNVYSAEYYDAASMIIEALKAGNRTREDVLDYVRNINYEGLTRTFQYTPEGEPQGELINIYQIQDGQIKWLGASQDLMP